MSTQRLISDARRRARAESRETGRPYQTILDEIAHRAGRAGWSAFVLDPAEPLPVEGSAEPDKPTFDPDGSQWDQWIHGTDQVGRVPLVLGITLILLAAVAPNHVRVDAPYAEEACLGVLMLGLGLLVASLWRPAYRTLLLYALSWSAPRPMGLRRAVVLAATMTARVSLVILVPTAFTHFGPLLMTGVTADAIGAYESDVLAHRRIRIEGMTRDTPVASYRTHEGRADLSIVVVDARLQPRPMRALFMGDDLGGRRMSEALKDSPVVRFAGSLDCRTGRFRRDRVEAAVSYDAPPAHIQIKGTRPGSGLRVSADDVRRLCHLDGQSL